MLCGGWAAHDVNESHHNILAQVQAEVNAKLASNHTFVIVEVRQQVVAGTNYQFKLKTDDERFVEVKVYEPLPYTNSPAQVTLAQQQLEKELNYVWEQGQLQAQKAEYFEQQLNWMSQQNQVLMMQLEMMKQRIEDLEKEKAGLQNDQMVLAGRNQTVVNITGGQNHFHEFHNG